LNIGIIQFGEGYNVDWLIWFGLLLFCVTIGLLRDGNPAAAAAAAASFTGLGVGSGVGSNVGFGALPIENVVDSES